MAPKLQYPYLPWDNAFTYLPTPNPSPGIFHAVHTNHPPPSEIPLTSCRKGGLSWSGIPQAREDPVSGVGGVAQGLLGHKDTGKTGMCPPPLLPPLHYCCFFARATFAGHDPRVRRYGPGREIFENHAGRVGLGQVGCWRLLGSGRIASGRRRF